MAEAFFSPSSAPDIPYNFYTPVDRPPIQSHPFTEREVAERLQACTNSSPGDDRIGYDLWKKIDPNCRLLTSIFNACLKFQKIPPSWKVSKTIFIHKGGDTEIPSSWRPISLSNTAPKLYASLWANRFSSWLEQHNILCPAQKGFRPHDGVFEHNFMVETLISNAKLQKGNASILFLDFSNAFGSIPHSAILAALYASGAGMPFQNIISDLYSGCSTSVVTEAGLSDSISPSLGVRQGCPLSPSLFNLAVDPVLRAALSLSDLDVRGGAYADDFWLAASSPAVVQVMLNSVRSLSSQIGIHINPSKCDALFILGGALDPSPTISVDDHPIRTLSSEDHTVFLGKPIGFSIINADTKFSDIICLMEKIRDSTLAPWQKIDAISSFIVPQLSFPLRMRSFSFRAASDFDSWFRCLSKNLLGLPENASSHFLHAPRSGGGAGLPVFRIEALLASIEGAFKLLTSKDPVIRQLASADLKFTVHSRYPSRPVTSSLVEEYLNSSSAPNNFGRKSLWSGARHASKALGICWALRDVDGCLQPTLIPDLCVPPTHQPILPHQRHLVLRKLRLIQQDQHLTLWKAQPDQGRAAPELARAGTRSGHFLRTGLHLRYSDFYWVHRARLNLTRGLRAGRAFMSNDDKNCRFGCTVSDTDPTVYHETLAHVLNHCHQNLRQITSRHNHVVSLIKSAATANKWLVLAEDEAFLNQDLRPDLVLRNGSARSVRIIDVTIPFEGGRGALATARTEKLKKYSALRQKILQCRGVSDVKIFPLVIGARGAWDPQNDRILRDLVHPSYVDSLRKLCISSVIRHSHDIFKSHISHSRLPSVRSPPPEIPRSPTTCIGSGSNTQADHSSSPGVVNQ